MSTRTNAQVQDATRRLKQSRTSLSEKLAYLDRYKSRFDLTSVQLGIIADCEVTLKMRSERKSFIGGIQ